MDATLLQYAQQTDRDAGFAAGLACGREIYPAVWAGHVRKLAGGLRVGIRQIFRKKAQRAHAPHDDEQADRNAGDA